MSGFTWATDPGAVVVEPPSGLKALGWVPGDKPTAGNLNWLIKTLAEGGFAPTTVTLESGEFEAKAAIATALADFATVAVDGLIYRIGGQDASNTHYNTVESYNPSTDAWTSRANLPNTRSRHAAAVFDGLIYVSGGFSTTTSAVESRMDSYDPASNDWTSRAALPAARLQHGMVASGGYIYSIGGGDSGFTAVGDANRYDPVANSWSGIAATGANRMYFAHGEVGGRPVIAGGFTGSGALDTVQAYDAGLDDWIGLAAMPDARRESAFAVHDGKLFAIGGVNAGGSQTASIYSYDTVEDSWFTYPEMVDTRSAGGAASVGGEIYLVGGLVDAVISTDVDAFDPTPPQQAAAPGTISVRSGSDVTNFTTGQTGEHIAVFAGDYFGIDDWAGSESDVVLMGVL